MANIFKSIEKSYDKTSKYLNQINYIFFALVAGVLLINVINIPNRFQSDNVFECKLTPIDEVIVMDTTELKTVTELSLINVNTQLFRTNLTKNEVPAIENPRYGPYSDISLCTSPNELVYVVEVNGIRKIYPRKLIEQHIAINDQFGDDPILISYSPLADHFAVYKRMVKDQLYLFGVSGYLYKNVDLLYDSKSESLWSQLYGKALVGSQIGAQLEKIGYIERITFKKAIEKYPDDLYITYDTGFRLDYTSDPFGSYRLNNKIVEDVEFFNNELLLKSNVFAFFINDNPFHLFIDDIEKPFTKTVLIEDHTYKIEIEEDLVKIIDLNTNTRVDVFSIYWFTWYDNYPDTYDLLKYNE